MKNNKSLVSNIIIAVIQVLLGAFLIYEAIYLDDIFYLELEGFFYHFLFVPGVVLIIMCLHYLIYNRYKNKSEFVFSGAICAFIIGNTGQCLVLLYENFPQGWIGYVVWFLLACLLTAFIVAIFHFVFMFINKKHNTVL